MVENHRITGAGPSGSAEPSDGRCAFLAARVAVTLLAFSSLWPWPWERVPAGPLIALGYTALATAISFRTGCGRGSWKLWLVGDSILVAVSAASTPATLLPLLPAPIAALYAVREGAWQGVLAVLVTGISLWAPVALGYPMPHLVHWGAALAAMAVVAWAVGSATSAERGARSAAEHLAVTDHLTGLHNQRYFYLRGPQEVARARRYLAPLSLLMIDIDEFKTINDRFGHLSGDTALRQVAGAITSRLRSSDLVFRYGGEEFAVILPETGGARAREVAERIRESVEAIRLSDGNGAELGLSVSIGVAEWQGEDAITELLARADGAAYGAKRGGRDRVEVSWFRVSGSGDGTGSPPPAGARMSLTPVGDDARLTVDKDPLS